MLFLYRVAAKICQVLQSRPVRGIFEGSGIPKLLYMKVMVKTSVTRYFIRPASLYVTSSTVALSLFSKTRPVLYLSAIFRFTNKLPAAS